MKRFSFIFILIIATSCVFAIKKKDTARAKSDSIRTKYFIEKELNYKKLKLSTVDSLHNSFRVFNPINKTFEFNSSLGNLGSAYFPLTFSNNYFNFSDCGKNPYNIYFKENENIRYYHTDKAFTELTYANGSKKEFYFNVLHTQNIFRNFNVGLNYQLINSLGYYEYQRNDQTNLIVFGHFYTKNTRYQILFNGKLDKIKMQENGGVSEDSTLVAGTQLQTAYNVFRRKSFYIKQLYDLAIEKHQIKKDTILKTIKTSRFRIVHSANIEEKSFRYSDLDYASAYYKNYFITPTSTYDSINIIKFENTFGFNLLNKDSANNFLDNINIYLGGKYQVNKLFQTYAGINNDFSSSFTDFSIYSKEDAKLFWKLQADYGINGYNKNNYNIKMSLNKKFGKRLNSKIFFDIDLNKKTPEYFLLHYISNNFIWNNNFNQSDSKNIDFGINIKGFELRFDYSMLSNYIFIDTNAMPNQFKNIFYVSSANLIKNFKLGILHLDNHLVYQKTNNSEIIRIPEFITKNSIYLNLKLFKKALFTNIGFDFLYYSSYYANSYMPATSMFYLQNYKKVGDYPYCDFFFSAKIKHANIFFKVERFNYLFMNKKPSSFPNYLDPGMALKFGISWIMLN